MIEYEFRLKPQAMESLTHQLSAGALMFGCSVKGGNGSQYIGFCLEDLIMLAQLHVPIRNILEHGESKRQLHFLYPVVTPVSVFIELVSTTQQKGILPFPQLCTNTNMMSTNEFAAWTRKFI